MGEGGRGGGGRAGTTDNMNKHVSRNVAGSEKYSKEDQTSGERVPGVRGF